jgi:RHS repeat-associated protein
VARKDGSGNVFYYFEEPAGRTRTVTNATGVACNEADYYLFGGEQTHGNTCNQNYHFAGMYRDSETGNDATQFRMYESNLGRWMSPDPVAGDVTNPQSLNRYTYVLNNPVNLIDPLGLKKKQKEPCHRLDDCRSADDANTVDLDPDDYPGPGPSPYDSHPGNNRTGFWTRAYEKVKQRVCSAIPEGRTIGVSGGIGGIGGQTGSLELVVNYRSGQVSGFASGGFQFGWNGVAQGSVTTGVINGDLRADNSGYKGAFNSVSFNPAVLGGYASASSGGGTNVVGGSAGLNLLGTPTLTISRTYYTKPLSLGKYWALANPVDLGFFFAKQACHD